jgi:S1-C subfamily serine protease
MSLLNTTIRFNPNDPATAEFLKFLEECGLPHDVAVGGTFTSEQLEAAGINSYYVTSLAGTEVDFNETLAGYESLSPSEAAQANALVSRIGADGLKALVRNDTCPSGMSGMFLWKNLTGVTWSHNHDVYVEKQCSYSTYTDLGFTPQDTVGLHFTDAMMPEAGQKLGRSVVSVGCDDWDGSAVIVSTDGTIATAAHVIYDDPDEATGVRAFAVNPYVEFNGVRYPFTEADVIASDTEADLTVVKVPGLAAAHPPAVKIASTAPAQDSLVMVVGYPAMAHRDDFQRLYTPGTFESVGPGPMGEMKEESYVHTDTKFHSGNSGGAIFNDKGELIAIVSGTLPGQENFSSSVILSTIQDPELAAALRAAAASRTAALTSETAPE